jgi:hypothetical protein
MKSLESGRFGSAGCGHGNPSVPALAYPICTRLCGAASWRRLIRGRGNSALESEIAPAATLDLSAASELERALTPALDVAAELFVPVVVEVELLSAEAAQPGEHVGEDRGAEAAILLGCKAAETFEAVAGLELHQVDEVASLGTSEQRKQLVDRQLLTGKHRSWFARLGWKQPGVGRQVEFRPIVGALDDQSRKAWVDLDLMHGETGFAECAYDGWDEPVDGIGAEAEEVQITRLAANVSTSD